MARAAWARLRWPSGVVLESQHLRRLDEPVPAGSIFKVIAARAALEQGIDLSALRVTCPRRLTVGGRQVDCVHPDVGRPLAVEDALAQSCNAYFARLAERLDRDGLARTLRRLVSSADIPLHDTRLPLVVLGLEGPELTMREWLLAVGKAVEPGVDVAVDALLPLRRGLERAAREGSAVALGNPSMLTYAKTGTVVGTPAAPQQEGHVVAWRPELGEALVVRVARGSGRDAARVAAAVWERAASAPQPVVRVGRLRLGTTDVTPVTLEDYVAGVVAAEGEQSMPAGTLEALAILARSYARAPDGRHARDGFDVCDTTHCQVYGESRPWSRRAAAATQGVVLWRHGHVEAAPYSAACGGTLIGRGADPVSHPVPTWHSEVTADALREALTTAGHRGDVLRGVSVRERQDGRPTVIGLDGLVPEAIDADRFRRAVGLHIGWHVLKSDEWSVTRTSRGYRFEGRGKGHSRGVCVAGATVLGTSGHSAMRILATYLPGVSVASLDDAVSLTLPGAWAPQRGVIEGRIRRALADVRQQLGSRAPRRWGIHVHPTVAAYQRETRRAWWTSASTRMVDGTAVRIDLAPTGDVVDVDRLLATFRHEAVHGFTMAPLSDAPLWALEGLALLVAEGENAATDGGGVTCPTDDEVARPGSAEVMREVYRQAARCVSARLPGGVATWRSLALASPPVPASRD